MRGALLLVVVTFGVAGHLLAGKELTTESQDTTRPAIVTQANASGEYLTARLDAGVLRKQTPESVVTTDSSLKTSRYARHNNGAGQRLAAAPGGFVHGPRALR